ncbi:hypothetical protein BJY04DRAFT_191148 [Aspergillus karnatakaensis]|uniref:SDR family oxidoreductase n=1 Tax=Aspergillus karnatakaensis TaxID=1810916 RepID=UPI003CCDB3A4
MPTYLITGTRRGIGLEYVRQLSTNSENTIVAVVRNLSDDLTSLKAISERPETKAKILLAEADLTKPASIAALPSQLPTDLRINTLIQNSGILRESSRNETSLTVTAESLSDHFTTNTIGPILLVQSLLPILAPGAIIANITSGMGSMTLLSNGTFPTANPAYSISKAALNMATVQLAKDLKGRAVVISIDPGHVKTEMGGPYASMEIGDSAGAILKTLSGLKEGDNGKFFQFDGAEEPW